MIHCFKKQKFRTGEMAPWLRALRRTCFFPSTHSTSVTKDPGFQRSLVTSVGTRHTHGTHTHMRAKRKIHKSRQLHSVGDKAPSLGPGLAPSMQPSGNTTRQPELRRCFLCYKYIIYIQNMTLKYYSMLQKDIKAFCYLH